MQIQRRKKMRDLAMGLLALSLIIGSGFLGIYLHSYQGPSMADQIRGQAIQGLSGMNVSLNVTATSPNGEKIASTYQPHDLILNNFIDFFSALFQSETASGVNTFQMTDNTDTSRYFSFSPGGDTCGGSDNGLLCTSSGIDTGGEVGIGTSATAPARTDYNLGAINGVLTAVSFPSWDGANENLTIAGSVTTTAAGTIQEAGYFLYLHYCGTSTTCSIGASSDNTPVMMMHDTFTGISVGIGDIIALSYTIHFPSDFTNNFGYLMEALFANSGGGNIKTSTNPTTEGGSSLAISTYSNSLTGLTELASISAASTSDPSILVTVGTGNTAPAATDYKLVSPVTGYGGVIGTSVTPNATITGSITLGSATNVTEWGIYFQNGEGTLSYWILVYRTTNSAVPVAKDQGVTVGLAIQM